ncbi:MAG: S9 family peptidase [Vicinamibacteria bacterium]
MILNRGRQAALCVAAVLSAGAAGAQQKPLTIDAIYDPETKAEFSGKPLTGLAWLSDTHYLQPGPVGSAPLKVEAATGKSEPFFEAARLETVLGRIEGVTPEAAKAAVRARSFNWSARRDRVLLPIGGDLYVYDLGAHKATRLTDGGGTEDEAAFSPDGASVSFVRAHDLYVVPAAGGAERRLTTDGGREILNGKLDWVYQEEIYGRGNFRGYWWSPDAKRLAFLRLDERKVPKYTIVDDMTTRPVFEVYPYPKAGEPNPVVTLGLADAAAGGVRFADLAKYEGAEILITSVGWRPDGRLVFQVQDREQTWLDLNVADAATGAVTTLFRETAPAWVESSGVPYFLKDGSFLWLSERDGWKHVYHYRADGTAPRKLTKGAWEVRALYGVDEAARFIYFSSTERGATVKDVMRVRLDGTGLERLSNTPGQHEALFNPSYGLYLDTWSDTATPPQVRLHEAGGREVRVVDANDVAALREYRLPPFEFFQVETRDRFPMEAALIKPPGFDPKKKYPVYQHIYGGPHAPQVRNGWFPSNILFLHLLAERGVVVFICDSRSASGKGYVSARTAYKKMGPSEMKDIEDGVAWLKQQPWVDPQRIGIGGWSYGGFLTAYALTHSTSFAMGIAGAPVTDWRNYDSIYTDRVMMTPENNPEGYRDTSVNLAAKDLSGQLLLLHGSVDDNVHPQNTLQLAYELQKAGKPFRMMMYPKMRHTPAEALSIKHLRTTMLDFVVETLRPGN